MEFKHGVFLVALACGAWALGVSTLIFLDGLSDVHMHSELPPGNSPITTPENFSSVRAIANTLNYYLPLGVLCIAFLAYTRNTNPIGIEYLCIALAVIALATHTSLRAGVALHEAGLAPVNELVWWM
jgi:hypothetical protein